MTKRYPTAWAYEQVCAARDKHQYRADKAESDAEFWKDQYEEVFEYLEAVCDDLERDLDGMRGYIKLFKPKPNLRIGQYCPNGCGDKLRGGGTIDKPTAYCDTCSLKRDGRQTCWDIKVFT